MLVTLLNAPLAGAKVKGQLGKPYNIDTLIVSDSGQRCYSILLVYTQLAIVVSSAVCVEGD